MIYAVYKDKTYECSILNCGRKIKLLSDVPIDGFCKGIGRYYLNVERENCERVYKKMLCFNYVNDNFLIKEEKDGKVLLETGPRSYDLTELGFKRVLNDIFQKWVSKTEGKEYWAYTEY